MMMRSHPHLFGFQFRGAPMDCRWKRFFPPTNMPNMMPKLRPSVPSDIGIASSAALPPCYWPMVDGNTRFQQRSPYHPLYHPCIMSHVPLSKVVTGSGPMDDGINRFHCAPLSISNSSFHDGRWNDGSTIQVSASLGFHGPRNPMMLIPGG